MISLMISALDLMYKILNISTGEYLKPNPLYYYEGDADLKMGVWVTQEDAISYLSTYISLLVSKPMLEQFEIVKLDRGGGIDICTNPLKS